MAGDAVSRFKTQVMIFFSVTMRKKFDSRTREGRARLGYFAALVLLLIVAVVVLSDSADTEVVIRTDGVLSGGGGGGGQGLGYDEEDDDAARGGAGEDDDEGDDDEGGGGGGGGGSFADDDDDDDEGGAGDAAAELKAEQQSRQANMKADFTKFFETYQHEQGITDFIDSYVSAYKGLGIIRQETIGKTYEKRPINAYTVGLSKARKHILVVGSEHGSEWSVPMYLTYVITRLVQLYGINDEVSNVLESVQIHVVPFVNPDGAFYSANSKSHDARHFTKNRAPIKKHSSTKGVELREDWGKMSQLETQAIKAYAGRLRGLSAFVGVQCCGGFVHATWNSSCIVPPAIAEQERVGKSVAEEMHIAHSYAFSFHGRSSKHSKVHTDALHIHWAQNTLGLNLAFTLSAAPVPADSKHKKHAATKVSDKKMVEVPEKELLTGSREITKGVVALGKYLADEEGPHPTALCDGASSAGGGDEGEEGEDPGQDEDEDEEPSSAAGEDEDDEEPESMSGEDDEEGDEDDGGSTSRRAEGGDIDEDEDSSPDGDEHQGFDMGQNEDGDEAEFGDHEGSGGDDTALERAKRYARGVSKTRVEAMRLEPKEPFVEGKQDRANALRYARLAGGVSAPLLGNLDQATLDGTGSHFLYFAYGPDMLYELLLSAGITSAVKVVNAQLDGFGFDYTYYSKKVWKSGIADVYKKRGGHVVGVIYKIDKQQRALLDRHNLAGSEESHVEAMQVTVHDKVGNMYPVMTYRVPLKIPGDDIGGKYRRFRPSRQYRNCVIKGAKQQHLSEDYIEKRLRAISPLYSDKVGSLSHRNPAAGTICDAAH